MNIWEILGIEPTRDQGAVRRAYAAAAARYNPEEHPEEFLAVRQAYEQALAFARSAEEPVEVPELPELTMPAQPLPAMEPSMVTAVFLKKRLPALQSTAGKQHRDFFLFHSKEPA